MSDNSKIIERIESAESIIKNKKSTLYFFVVNSKNIPNGSMSYIYQLAKYLYDCDYDVKMIYQLPNEYDKEELEGKEESDIDDERIFHPASEWMGKEYDGIPHMNISKEEWKVSPSDFLFIPEAFSGLMFETYKHKIPCKRYVILQNYNYVTEFIPLGVEWSNYGIFDAICSTSAQEKKIKEVFPYIKTHILNPYIDDCFRPNIKPKNLIVNIISKNQNDINKIIKPFYWKYPIYKFVSFRDLRNFDRKEYAELLKESAITVWVDTDSQFGYGALEAMRCNNIVIGKMTDDVLEWSSDGNILYDNVIWFSNFDDVHKIIASVIGSWMRDQVPSELKNAVEKTNLLYKFEDWKGKVEQLINSLFESRIKELEETKIIAKNNENDK